MRTELKITETIESRFGSKSYAIEIGNRFVGELCSDEALAYVVRWLINGDSRWLQTYEKQYCVRHSLGREIAGLLTHTPLDDPHPTVVVANFLFNPAA